MTTIDVIKNRTEELVERVLEKAPKRGYICPNPECDNGKGSNGTGIELKPNTVNFKCFKCGEYMSIIDIIAYRNNLDPKNNTKQAIDICCNMLGIQNDYQANEIFSYQKSNSYEYDNIKKVQKQAQSKQNETRVDLSDFINQGVNDIKETPKALNYLKNRGITDETIINYSIGYNKRENSIIIPYNQEKTYFIQRSIDDKAKIKHIKLSAEKVGQEPIFNQSALFNDNLTSIYVVESPLCAISILQVNTNENIGAIALGGIGYKKLIELINQNSKIKDKILLLSLDNDKSGQVSTNDLKIKLNEIKQPYLIANVCNSYKDPNEHLCANSIMFTEEVNKLRDGSNYDEVQNLLTEIINSQNKTYISTGFKVIDNMLDNGLYEGLYIMGAVSSLGKTTLMLQIADQIAYGGNDVLYFSLEMSKKELMTKSVSRLTAQMTENVKYAKTVRGISNGDLYSNYSSNEMNLIEKSFNTYRDNYSKNLYMFEGIGDIGINEITSYIVNHIKRTNRKPVVFIDYIQIIAPHNERATDKQNTDKAVLELKRMSRDYNLPIFAISSFNRENYTKEVSTKSFKESGTIEYSSDVLIGLQYKANYSDTCDGVHISKAIEDNIEKAKNPNEFIDIEFVLLKNRNGGKGKCCLSFRPMFNEFKEVT